MNTSIQKRIHGIGHAVQVVATILIVLAVLRFLSSAYYLIQTIADAELWSDNLQGWKDAITGYAGSILSAPAMIIVLVFLKRIAEKFRYCETPFTDDIVRRMTVFAWVLLGYAFFAGLVGAATTFLKDYSTMQQYETSFAFSDTITNTAVALLLPTAWHFSALIVLFLTLVFKHGAELQKESDETL